MTISVDKDMNVLFISYLGSISPGKYTLFPHTVPRDAFHLGFHLKFTRIYLSQEDSDD